MSPQDIKIKALELAIAMKPGDGPDLIALAKVIEAYLTGV